MSSTICKTFDLSNDRDYAQVLDLFGGEARLEKYPCVREALEQQRRTDGEMGIGQYRTILETDTDDLRNAVYFPGIYYDVSERKLIVYYALSYSKEPVVQWFTIKIYDETGVIIAKKSISPLQPKQFTAGKHEFTSLKKSTRYTVELIDLTTFRDRYLSVTELQETVTHCLEAVPVFGKRAKVLAPKKNRDDALQDLSGDDEAICAIYNRYPFDNNVDYVYEDACERGIVHVKLEAAGNIELSQQVNVDRMEMGQDLAIMDFGNGAVRYKEAGADLQVANRTFQWLFRPDWGQKTPMSYYLARTRVHLTYKVGFYQRPNTYEDILYMSSLLDADMGYSCRKIRSLVVSVGCVKEGTLVTMADGSKKKIEQIKIGEQVRVDTEGMCGEVTNTWKGDDKELFWIETADGKQVAVTAGHYVATDQGYVMAEKMNMGMRVLVEDGSCQELRYLYTTKEDAKVYNLSVAAAGRKGGSMICGGICLADNDYQPEPPRRLMADTLQNEIPQAVQELKKLIQECMREK